MMPQEQQQISSVAQLYQPAQLQTQAQVQMPQQAGLMDASQLAQVVQQLQALGVGTPAPAGGHHSRAVRAVCQQSACDD